MFQKQKQRILAQYSLSPRCLQSGRTRPYNQFYSWKNYLNADVDHFYRRIKRQENNQCTSTSVIERVDQNQPKINMEMGDYERNPKNLYNQTIHDNSRQSRNCYSKVQIATNTPIRQKNYYQKHRHSNSVFSSDKQLQKDDKTTIISVQTDSIIFQSGVQSKIQKYDNKEHNSTKQEGSNQKQSDQSNQSNAQFDNFSISAQNRKCEKQLFMKKNKKSIAPFQSKHTQCNINQLDQYHLRLKQQQRLYLLKKFMQHYEGIHKFKL